MHRLAVRDLEQRTGLGPDTVGAVTNLGDIKQRLFREILCEVLERCFFLYYWSGKHDKVATTLSWPDLVDKASGIILDLTLTPRSCTSMDANRRTSRPTMRIQGPGWSLWPSMWLARRTS